MAGRERARYYLARSKTWTLNEYERQFLIKTRKKTHIFQVRKWVKCSKSNNKNKSGSSDKSVGDGCGGGSSNNRSCIHEKPCYAMGNGVGLESKTIEIIFRAYQRMAALFSLLSLQQQLFFLFSLSFSYASLINTLYRKIEYCVFAFIHTH